MVLRSGFAMLLGEWYILVWAVVLQVAIGVTE